jgi:hypothetical protein
MVTAASFLILFCWSFISSPTIDAAQCDVDSDVKETRKRFWINYCDSVCNVFASASTPSGNSALQGVVLSYRGNEMHFRRYTPKTRMVHGDQVTGSVETDASQSAGSVANWYTDNAAARVWTESTFLPSRNRTCQGGERMRVAYPVGIHDLFCIGVQRTFRPHYSKPVVPNPCTGRDPKPLTSTPHPRNVS